MEWYLESGNFLELSDSVLHFNSFELQQAACLMLWHQSRKERWGLFACHASCPALSYALKKINNLGSSG